VSDEIAALIFEDPPAAMSGRGHGVPAGFKTGEQRKKRFAGMFDTVVNAVK
jgi:hypothetical protein